MKLRLLASLAVFALAGHAFADDAKPAPPESAGDWSAAVAKALPEAEKPIALFNGTDLTGWEGWGDFWSVEDGAIVGRNSKPVPSSTYLFTREKFRNFRLIFEVKQTMSRKHSTMHSAIAALGEKIEDGGGNTHGFRGSLLMFCHDWGVWDAHRRNRVEPANHKGTLNGDWEKKGEWNRIEILALGDRIRFAANGKLVFDFTDKPGMLTESPLYLQLHANRQPQEFRFRGLIAVKDPKDQMVTVAGE